MLDNCRLCPRNCGVKRDEGQIGYCKMSSELYVSRASLHYWEEPCISGKEGSGTVFFVGCNLRCIFCQNRKIAMGDAGKKITVERLSEIFLELQAKGANNINLVTPTHYIPQIAKAIGLVKNKELKIPVVYNSGGYDKPEALKLLEGLVDIWMPDFKYYESKTAKNFSNAPDYVEVAKSALAEMVRQKPRCLYDERGMMKEGVIVRHMLLPKHVYEGKQILKYLYETYGNSIVYSIMSQYTPMMVFEDYPELSRKVRKKEYESLVDFCLDLGIENAYIQEGDPAKESFIPDFDNRGV